MNFAEADRQELFFEGLCKTYAKSIRTYHGHDGLLVLNRSDDWVDLINEATSFYKEERDNVLLDKLAQIPFHLAISTTPDISINQAFTRQEFDAGHQYFKINSKHGVSETPSKYRPVLYNLLGCAKDDESLIITHSDLFKAVKYLSNEDNLPDWLIKYFREDKTRSIIFLGFEFDKWYFHLILYLFQIELKSCKRYATSESQPKNEHHQVLVESEFRVNFVDTNMLDFVNKLHAQFNLEELRKPVQAVSENRKYILDRIFNFLENAFDTGSFETFCFIHFGDVYRGFPPAMDQKIRIGRLLIHAESHGLIGKLLEEGQKSNSYQYDKWAPYYER